MGQFRYLDEIALADCAVEVSAASVNDLFETAGRALTELMVDPDTVPISLERHITLEAQGLDLLLFDWLSDLIGRKDADGEVFVRARIDVTGAGPYRLDARLEGGPIVRGRTGLRADAKGVTLHQFLIEPLRGGWHARFVVDL